MDDTYTFKPLNGAAREFSWVNAIMAGQAADDLAANIAEVRMQAAAVLRVDADEIPQSPLTEAARE